MRYFLILPFACLVLAGCVAMSVEECRTSNWFDLGMRDGLAGIQRMEVAYEHQCGKFGVVPDSQAYVIGWQDGHWEYEKRAIRDSTD